MAASPAPEPASGDPILDALLDAGLRAGFQAPCAPAAGLAPSAVRYHIQEELARGGMGVILRGRDEELRREVAIKLLRPEHAATPEMVRRFVEEAQIGGQLQHPGILPTYDLGQQEDGRPFFIMKLMEGQNLAERLEERSDPAADRPRLLRIFAQVCETVAYAHARGVIHRDLKPSNVLVGTFGEVQVIDWGLARVLSNTAERAPGSGVETSRTHAATELSRSGVVLGTPGYMAPEQARGELECLDRRSDVFSLGAMLCEILTGAPPHVGESGSALGNRAVAARLDDARQRLEACGADDELIALGRECLASEPPGRPSDAGVLARRIGAHLAALDERRRRAELAAAEAHVLAAQERRARRLLAALALAVIAALVIGGGAFYWIRGERQARTLETSRAANAALADARELRIRASSAGAPDPSALAAALAAARRAESLAASGSGSDELRREARVLIAGLQQIEADCDMLARLEEIRMRSFEQSPEKTYASYNWAREDREYSTAFRAYGLDLEHLDIEIAAREIRASAISIDLLLALRSWSAARSHCGGGKLGKLSAVLGRASPPAWKPLVKGHVKLAELRELAAIFDLETRPTRIQTELGIALAAKGDASLAVSILRNAQDHHPERVAVHLGLAYILMKGMTPPALEEAARCYQAALALRPRSLLAMHHLARVLIELGETARPLDLLHRVIELRPGLAWARYELGGGYRDTGNLSGAVRYYREATEVDPEFAEAWFNLAAVQLGSGDLEGAIRAAHKATELRPDWALAWAQLGGIVGRGEDLSSALKACRKALKLDPELAAAHYNLGIVLEKNSDRDGAISAIRRAVELDAEDVESREKLFLSLAAAGDLPGALAACRKGLELQPQNLRLKYGWGYLSLKAGKLRDALEALEAVRPHQPENRSLLLNIGLCLQGLARYAEAVVVFQRLLILGYPDPQRTLQIEQWLGECRHNADLKSRLESYLASDSMPEDAEELLGLGQICRIENRNLAAARFYREAVEREADGEVRLNWNQRYAAVGTAVLAGCGKGCDSKGLDPVTRAKWRSWARAVIEEALARFADAPPADREDIRGFLNAARCHEAMANVRDERALKLLLEAEQQTWRSLWVSIDVVLRKK